MSFLTPRRETAADIINAFVTGRSCSGNAHSAVSEAARLSGDGSCITAARAESFLPYEDNDPLPPGPDVARWMRKLVEPLATSQPVEIEIVGIGEGGLEVSTTPNRNRIKLTKNFSLHEFESPDTGEVVLDPELVTKLQALRDKLGRPVIVNSGYRTPEHNNAVGGASESYHKLGMAADIHSPGVSVETLAQLAEAVGFRGIGRYSTFVHVDTRPTPARWTG